MRDIPVSWRVQPWRDRLVNAVAWIVIAAALWGAVAVMQGCQSAKEAGEVGGGALAGGAIGFIGGPIGAAAGGAIGAGITHTFVENERLSEALAVGAQIGRETTSVREAAGLPRWLFWTIIGLIAYFVFTHPKVVEPFRTLFYALRNRFFPPAVGTHIPPAPPPVTP